MADAILNELEGIITWASALPEKSTTVPVLIFEDLIELIRYHFSEGNPRDAVCVLWPRLCTLVNEASNEAGIPAPWR
jgi:hypothetical protein